MLIPLKERSFLSMLKTKGRNLGIKGHTEPFELHTSYGTKRARGFFGISVNDNYIVTIQNNKKIVYLHKRNFEISNSRHADERNTNWSYAMLSRDTKNAF